MTDAPELLPCPFCGGQAADAWFDDEGTERGEVYCTGCSASTQGSYQGWMRDNDDIQQSINQAISAWNTRADLARPRGKPLVWEGEGFWSVSPNEGWLEEANTPFGWGYSIEFDQHGTWAANSTFGWSQDGFETPDSAKAAAQADFERRIMECLL